MPHVHWEVSFDFDLTSALRKRSQNKMPFEPTTTNPDETRAFTPRRAASKGEREILKDDPVVLCRDLGVPFEGPPPSC